LVDVLSQSEIDTLLAALSRGEVDGDHLKKDNTQRRVKVYDFKRAVRFSKDHIRSLTRIHETFARYLSTYFSAQLRTFVQINVVQVEQLPYEEFVRSIPSMTILNIFQAEPFEGRLVLEVNPNIAYTLLDRLFGGFGGTFDEVANLTEIEQVVIERVFGNALESFREAWKTVVDITPEHEALETNPQFMQIVSPNETIALISLSVKVGDATGMMNLCIPHVTLEPYMQKLSVNNLFFTPRKERNEEEEKQIHDRVQKTKVDVIALLGETSITVEELLQLSTGDCLKLDNHKDDMIRIKVGEDIKFIGSPGISRHKMAVQIVEHIEEGVEQDDEQQ
jgi:flagellar motor switch protein FliM